MRAGVLSRRTEFVYITHREMGNGLKESPHPPHKSLKPNADSHHPASWHTDAHGFLEHAPSGDVCSRRAPPRIPEQDCLQGGGAVTVWTAPQFAVRRSTGWLRGGSRAPQAPIPTPLQTPDMHPYGRRTPWDTGCREGCAAGRSSDSPQVRAAVVPPGGRQQHVW